MYAPLFQLRSFDTIGELGKTTVLLHLLEALIAANLAYLRKHPTTPTLYASGVIYVEEPGSREHWQDIPETLLRREGDCEDLCCWRVAELRLQNEHAIPFLRSRVIGRRRIYHVAVQRGDGCIEDPSRRLGMR
jgi:hypothetical protein